ncbi:hypothetical protein HKCCE2091_12710 [Rhodobacterales bacterium HKCCE2091]|nr:hypothetical protein [Rhodobacterales bacterium HKCCE2091]
MIAALRTFLSGAIVLVALLPAAVPGRADAQVPIRAVIEHWQHRLGHDGDRFDAVMVPPGREFALACGNHDARPSPVTAELGVTDAGPYMLNVSVPAALVPDARDRLSGAILVIEGSDYALPVMRRHPDRPLYFGRITMTDPLVGALADPSTLFSVLMIDGERVAAPNVWGVPVDTVLRHCVGLASADGGRVPAGLSDYEAPVFAPLSNRPATFGPEPPSRLPRWLLEHVGDRCGWHIDLRQRAFQFEDLDGDGEGDFVVDYNAMVCEDTATVCTGREGCEIEVWLSGTGPVTPADVFLGTAIDLRLGAFGAPALVVWGGDGACEDGACDDPIAWDGDGFARQNDPAAPLPVPGE